MPTSRQDDGCTDRRQEEEEEEVEVEEDKEEEEETSQGQVDQNEDDVPASPKSAPETESGDVVMDEKRSSDVEEPVFQARRTFLSSSHFVLLEIDQVLHVDPNYLRFQ